MGRALGKYQVMSENVRPWSKEVLGREVSPQEFIQNPQLQDAIFNGKFGQYVDKYGPDGAARAWFAGEKGMKNPNARDAFGTTVAEYSRRFNKALGPQDAVAAVNQFAPEAPQAMAFAAQPNMSPAAPQAANFFDQFDEQPAAPAEARPATSPSGARRVYITPEAPQAAPDAPAGAPPPGVPADRGALDAAARGAAQGFTANFGDEIRGLVEASGVNPNDPASLSALISGALKYWTGDPEAKKRYDAAVARERAANQAAEEQHPIANTVGTIGGALVLPVGAGAGASTLAGRMAAGAGTGAVLGGAAGAGEGQGAVDRISRAAVGAGAGGLLGGAAPAAIEGVVRGARAVATPIANTVRGIRNPDSEAARRVVTAIERDQAIDPQAAQRLTPGEFAASVQGGGPAVIGDLGGETTRALARSAANTSPEGRAVLNRAINDRFEGQSGRVTDWLRNTFHYPDAEAQSEALLQASRNVNRPAYQRAYRDGAAGLWDDGLDQLSQAPVVQDAIRKATITGANDAARRGFTPVRNPFVMNRQTGRMELRTDANGTVALPSLQFWDTVKKNLDQVGTRDAQDFSRVLRDHLDQLVPSYAQARAGAAHFFGARDALEAGQNFVGRNMSAAEARRALAQMSPTERQLFQDGFVSRYVETLNQIGDRRSVLNKIAESPAAREKLNIALGPQRAAELEAGLRVEGIMDLARNAVQGNSTTARQLAELGLAGGAYGFSGGGINPFTDPGAVVNAALVYGAARGRNAINERLSRRVAEMLVSNDPRTITRGIQTIARNQNLFNSLRTFDRSFARVGGEQSPGIPALQAAGVGRADDQPNVQGPRP
ncbi:hypothetical protein [Bradyrhizobium sp. Leo121]|uniref:hypothetical protein n=1 Tax=Bradyrhizobium sp. Leo121 TaxID=1571195 RepID=UPI00102A19C6|nr:hypothetical protein [Bradyrhizobium sp. Leo121]